MSKGAAKIRLAVAAGLFLAWLCWLGYLVIQTRHPVILSRPQFIVADLWVVGHLKGTSEKPEATFAIQKVLWARDKEDEKLKGDVFVWDLPFADKSQGGDKSHGWAGPRDYLLPLRKYREGKNPAYEMTPIPSSPGYRPGTVTIRLDSAGKKKEQVAQLIVDRTGMDLAMAKEKVKKADPDIKISSDIKKNVPHSKAEDIKKEFKELGASVSLHPEEIRIYPATPEALEQLKEIPMK